MRNEIISLMNIIGGIDRGDSGKVMVDGVEVCNLNDDKRVFLENKAQYIGSIVLIIFGCFMFTLMSQFAMNFEHLANEFQEGYVQEDAAFTTVNSIDNLHGLESAANAMIEEGLTFDYKLVKAAVQEKSQSFYERSLGIRNGIEKVFVLVSSEAAVKMIAASNLIFTLV